VQQIHGFDSIPKSVTPDNQLAELCAPTITDEDRHQLAPCDDLLRDQDVPERHLRLVGILLVQGALHLSRRRQTLRNKKVADSQNGSRAPWLTPTVQCRLTGRFEPDRLHLVLAGMVGHHVTKSLKLQRQDSFGHAMLRDADHDPGYAPQMLVPTDDLDRDALLLDDVCNAGHRLILSLQADH
jgi:hypothetical protein